MQVLINKIINMNNISKIKYFGCAALLSLGLLTGCSKNEVIRPESEGLITIKAVSASSFNSTENGPVTKVTYDPNYQGDYTSLVWGVGDNFQLYGDDMEGSKFTIVAHANYADKYTANESFTGTAVEGATKAFFPATKVDNETYNDVTVASPEGWNHQTLDFTGQMCSGWSNSLSSYTYMVGEIGGTTDNPTISFSHLTSQIEFKLTLPDDYSSADSPYELRLVATDGSKVFCKVQDLNNSENNEMTDTLSLSLSYISLYNKPYTMSLYMKVAPLYILNTPMKVEVLTNNEATGDELCYSADLGNQTVVFQKGKQYTLSTNINLEDDGTSGVDVSNYSPDSYTLSSTGKTLKKWIGSESLVDLTQDPAFAELDSIESHAFEELATLKKVVMGDNIISIGNSMFYNCTSLTNVTLPSNSNITSTGMMTFYGCTSLKSITLPSTINKIGLSAFSGCTSLSESPITNSIDTIESSAFQSCNALTSIYLTSGSKLKYIGSMAFMYCSGLKIFNLGNDYAGIIPNDAFIQCTSLTLARFPETTTGIGFAAFKSCWKLKNFTVPAGVTSIGKYAFLDTGIETIDIPASVTFIGQIALSNCKDINVEDGNPNYVSVKSGEHNGLFTKDLSYLIHQYVDSEEYIVPEQVDSIQRYAFAYSDDLKVLRMGSNVNKIETSAFSYVSNLSEIHYNKKSPVGIIGEDEYLFSPSSLYQTVKLYVPSSAVSKFQTTNPWSNFTSIIGENFE